MPHLTGTNKGSISGVEVKRWWMSSRTKVGMVTGLMTLDFHFVQKLNAFSLGRKTKDTSLVFLAQQCLCARSVPRKHFIRQSPQLIWNHMLVHCVSSFQACLSVYRADIKFDGSHCIFLSAIFFLYFLRLYTIERAYQEWEHHDTVMPLMYVLWEKNMHIKEVLYAPAQAALNHSHCYATMIGGCS